MWNYDCLSHAHYLWMYMMKNKSSPLIHAARKSHSQVVRYLLERGADVNAQVNVLALPHIHLVRHICVLQQGRTALHVVYNYDFGKSLETIALLLKHGADLSAVNNVQTFLPCDIAWHIVMTQWVCCSTVRQHCSHLPSGSLAATKLNWPKQSIRLRWSMLLNWEILLSCNA